MLMTVTTKSTTPFCGIDFAVSSTPSRTMLADKYCARESEAIVDFCER